MTTASQITETYIREMYATLATLTGTPAVPLSVIRVAIPVSRGGFDRAIRRMVARQDGVHVRAEADQKTLTAADTAAAIILGGTARHTLLIES
jgi:hypothetical protein